MTEELKTDLDRAARHYAPPSDAWPRLVGRREREQSHRRRMALGVGLGAAALSLALLWFVLHPGHRASSGPRPGAPSSPNNGELLSGELLYAKKSIAGWNLFAVDLTTGAERQITNGVRDYGSDWSPDGTRIVYDSEKDDSDTG